MPEFSSSTYSATDASNTSASPNGAPENMAPSGVNDSLRALMGATKRFWQRIQGAGFGAGSANTYTITYSPALAALVDGERYSFRVAADNSGASTLNINGLGATAIKKMSSSGKADLASGDLKSGQPVTVEYDGTHFVLVTPIANLVTYATTAQAKTASSTAVAMTPAAAAAGGEGAWADLASATTTDLGAQDVTNLRITGTTTITGFGTIDSGVRRVLRFAAALTLTHNATSLILPGGANITTAAGDTLEAVSLGSGNWVVIQFQKATGAPPLGGSWVKGNVVTTTNASLNTRTSSLAHGLGAIPDMMRVELECLTAEQGFSIGDKIPLDGLHTRDISVVQVRADATNITVETTNNSLPAISHATASPPSTAVTITAANWRYRITPYRFVA